MSDTPLALAHRLMVDAVDELTTAAGPKASDDDLLSVLTLCEGVGRRLDRLTVAAVADLQRRGTFTDRGYRSTVSALGDLLGWSGSRPAVGSPPPSRSAPASRSTAPPCPRGSPPPRRCSPPGGRACATSRSSPGCSPPPPPIGSRPRCGPAQSSSSPPGRPTTPRPSCRPGAQPWSGRSIRTAPNPTTAHREVNELHVTRNPGGAGGRLAGRLDDAAMFDAVATVIDAHARPRTADDDRTPAQRQAEALAEVCGYVLDHGDVPECGGTRPHLNVIVRLEDLEDRARSAMLDFGGTLSPESLRLLACDAAVVPTVLGGKGQPLDVGRLTRVIPDGLRRAVAARDRGCAHPGCDRRPSWCEVHHVREWEHGGDTKIDNLVMLPGAPPPAPPHGVNRAHP